MAPCATCPAATLIDNPAHGPSVVCGVLRRANEGEQIDGWTVRGQVSPFISGREEPKTIVGLCCGDGVPTSLSDEELDRRPEVSPHYTACPTWRAGKRADWAGRRGVGRLHDRAHRERNPVLEELGFKRASSTVGA